MDEQIANNAVGIVKLPADAQNEFSQRQRDRKGRNMRWPNFLHRHQSTPGEQSLNIDGVVTAGICNRSAAYRAIKQLEREQRQVEREQHAIHAKTRHVDARQVRGIVISDFGAPELAAYQISEGMRDANQSVASQDGQLAALDERLELISSALDRLYTYLRDSR